MVEKELISGDGWISDDSSFYGDEGQKERLLSESEAFKIDDYWSTHDSNLNVVVSTLTATPLQKMVDHGQGRPDSWHLGESPEDFVKRLPPLTTSRMDYEWIRVYNPFRDDAGHSRTSEFVSRGQELLARSLQARADIQSKKPSKSPTTISRKLNDESKLLQQRITDLAVETNVLSGKWMLFPETDDLARVWRLVVDGVINRRLGTAAKVAPDEGRSGPRLICVYTRDFRDKEDVLRVLQELVSIGVAGPRRPIYYKSDPYTLLNIYKDSAAKYGLYASLYSSQKMLSRVALAKTLPALQTSGRR